MSRIETSNTWEEGLVMDLNPLSTPNSVLTDCLNGTLITYNGNEFSLQNDQGNYKLKHCKLKPNYIPVGLKEHGDILYIVSYNPLDKTVEIGSYPSPLMISETNDKDSENNILSILKSADGEIYYKQAMENASNIIFNGDDFKLNPGDKYCLQASKSDLCKYEKIDYYILGEDAGLFDITDKIKIDDLDTIAQDEDFQHVAWTVPGWLNIKTRLAEIKTSGINVKHFYVPKGESGNRTARFSFNLRINIEDVFLTRKDKSKSILEEWCENWNEIGFKINIRVKDHANSEWYNYLDNYNFLFSDTNSDKLVLGKSDWSDWYDDCRILWKEISGIIPNLNDDSIVEVKVMPIIKSEHYTIVYDNCEQTICFDLKSVDDKVWNIGTDLYQFYLGDDLDENGNPKNIMIYTDIIGPLISSLPVTIGYKIGQVVQSGINYIYEINSIQDYKGIGENIIKIPFTKSFTQENIYIITFVFKDQYGKEFKSYSRYLITSEIFSKFKDRLVYDRDISFKEWIEHYWLNLENKFEIEHEELEKDSLKNYIVCDTINDVFITDSDIKYLSGDKYNTFFNHVNPGLSFDQTLNMGYLRNYLVDCNFEQKTMNNGLWKNLQINNSFESFDSKENEWLPIVNENNFTVQLYDVIKLLVGYDKLNMPFKFLSDFSVHNLGDSIKFLMGENNDWLLKDKPINVSIEINGRKVDDDDKKTITVSCSWNGKVGSKKIDKTIDNNGSLYETFIKDWIKDEVFDKNPKLPFCLLKVSYTLLGRSDNFHLAQYLYGQSSGLSESFDFHFNEDDAKDLYFVAFRGGQIPVFLPLSETDGVTLFKNMCNGLDLVTDCGREIDTDRYLLKIKNKEVCVPELIIRLTSKIVSKKYYGFDLLNYNEKKNMVDNFLNCEHSSIFLDGTENVVKTKSNIIYEKQFETSLISTEFPYTTGYNRGNIFNSIDEVEGILNRLNSNSEKDFIEWDSSIFIQEYLNRIDLYGSALGFYSKHAPYTDSLIKELTKSYNNDSIMLKPAEFNKDLAISGNRVALEGNGEINNWTGKFAEWIVFHNWWKIIDGSDLAANSKDWYVSIGGCWKEDPSALLTQTWNWITYGL